MTDSKPTHDEFRADYSVLEPEGEWTVDDVEVTVHIGDDSIDLPTWDPKTHDGELHISIAVDAVTGFTPIPTDREVTVETPLEIVEDCTLSLTIEHGILNIFIHP